jgi:hypothetical protein
VNLVFFPFHDWEKSRREGFRTRDGHVLQGLMESDAVDHVTIVNRPIPLPFWFRDPRILVSNGYRIRRLSARHAIVDTVDMTWITLLKGLNRNAVYRWWPSAVCHPKRLDAVRKALTELRVEPSSSIGFFCTPFEAAAAPAYGFRRLVFDGIDDWEIHPLMAAGRDWAIAGYNVVRSTFDLCFAVSGPLARKLSGGRPAVSEIRNGVPSSMLYGPLALPGAEIGYAGKMSSRIDVDLVAKVAAVSPVPIKLAGPILDRSTGRQLRKISNCRLIGDLPRSQLPHFIDGLRVCLIPHSVGANENGGDPIKLYEYLARGRVVVTTPILGVDRFSLCEGVRIADTAHFAGQVLSAYRNPMEPNEIRRCLSLEDTWEFKVAKMIELMHPLAASG